MANIQQILKIILLGPFKKQLTRQVEFHVQNQTNKPKLVCFASNQKKIQYLYNFPDEQLYNMGNTTSQIHPVHQNFTYDLFVIGGGSAGLAAASAAAAKNVKVGLADYVKPSPNGSTWGLGGTCVNVGCIPKKLFHYAALLGQSRQDLKSAGWNSDLRSQNQWTELATKIQDYVKSMNNTLTKKLDDGKVKYYNKYAKLVSAHQVELVGDDGVSQIVSAKYILLATGSRPSDPKIPGKQHAITSDDLFWMKEKPGRTLIVGASYIALQCGGFLYSLGVDVSIMVRSKLLRGFDQQMADKIGNYMTAQGVKFIKPAVPLSISLTEKGQKKVVYKLGEQEVEEVFDTVMFAIGRSADTKSLNLKEVGVKVAPNGKIVAQDNDQTSVPNIYAIGDCVNGRLELTPTAILAAKLLVNRLMGLSTRLMSYRFVPTTVFTPLQYGCCGYTEQDAITVFGKQNIVAYGSQFKPLQWNLNEKRTQNCYAKLIVNKAQDNKVVGFHLLGPNAGEVTQGFAIAILKGITKDDLDNSVGIHPTLAQEFTTLKALAGSEGEGKGGCG